jgi:hypothetical protein
VLDPFYLDIIESVEVCDTTPTNYISFCEIKAADLKLLQSTLWSYILNQGNGLTPLPKIINDSYLSEYGIVIEITLDDLYNLYLGKKTISSCCIHRVIEIINLEVKRCKRIIRRT